MIFPLSLLFFRFRKRIMIIIFIILYWVLFLEGIQYIYVKIKVNDREQRQLVNNIFKQSSTSSTDPYFVGNAEFLTNVIPLICRYLSIFFRFMMKLVFRWIYWSTVAKSVDVEMRRHCIFTSWWKIWYRFVW